MSAPTPPAGPPDQRLRHPAEVPLFVVMVVLNVAIIAFILRAVAIVPFLPEDQQDSQLAIAIRTALIGLLLLLPGLIVVREAQRASVRGTAVQLSERQYPELYRIAQEFADRLGLRRRPDIFLANGNGQLNAFAAQATRHDYVVLSNELFANLYHDNREGLRFILGHEMAHIRLHHVGLWYQLSIAYSQNIPLLGQALSRLREYSCDRHGAYLEQQGQTGLVLLASGRYTERDVDVDELLHQARHLRGFWVALAQLVRSHPFTVRRVEQLYRLGLFAAAEADETPPAPPSLPEPVTRR